MNNAVWYFKYVGFDTSNIELIDLYQKKKRKKVTGLMKDELGGKIMTKFVELRAKTNSYLVNGDSEDEKAKGKESVLSKENLYFRIVKTA